MNNIILIGMPGSGKSTIGTALAKKLQYTFIDSDDVIEEHAKLFVHEIIERYGVSVFLELENRINQQIHARNSVISTGGSAVYGDDAMKHFKNIGTILYLKLNLETLKLRLGDFSKRGIAIEPYQSLSDIYTERVPLYEKYADITIDCNNKSIDIIVDEICDYFL